MRLGQIGIGICFGVSIDTSLNTIFDNSAIGIPLGLCICMFIGLILGMMKDKNANKQLEEKGYTILTIEHIEENDDYIITIVDKFGESNIINISKGHMETKDFQIGDFVYLDDDGLIEQAFDKEDGSNTEL